MLNPKQPETESSNPLPELGNALRGDNRGEWETGAEPVVFVVDDDAEMRDRRVALTAELGWAVDAFADTAPFLKVFDPVRPGCLILDAHLPDTASVRLLEELEARKASLPVIATTTHAEVDHVVQMMRAGAFDVLQKPLSPARVLEAIRAAVARDVEAHRQHSEQDEVRRRLARLTRRERQVLNLVVAGMSSKAIAAELGLQEKTIEVYRSNINTTMKARNAVELVRLVSRVQ